MNIDPALTVNSQQFPPALQKGEVREAIPLERYQLLRIIQAMVDGVLVFDGKGHIQLCNHAFEKMFNQTQEAIAGRPLRDFFDPISPELSDVILQLMDSGESFSQEIKLYPNNQERVFLLSTIPIEDDGTLSQGVVAFHDVTKEKQTEKMRRDFVANVSHELRTPLSAINGYAETLLEGALQDETVARDFIQIIFNHSNRLSQLVRDLLDLSKLDSEECPFELQPIDLLPCIQKVIELSQNHINEKQIRLCYEPPATLPMILAHDTSIEQVLTNLLDNAIKYTPAEGVIQVRVACKGNSFIQFDVEDNGMGIEAKHIPRLFERFYRVDKARSRDLGGTGLGLAIVKHIIQYHGGEVWVNSTPGKGSTFSFTLQIAQESETALPGSV